METDSATTYGRRLIPMVLDRLADTDPGMVYAAIPKTANVKDGYRDVSIADFARCVDFMAQWIEDKFGRSNNFETITYIGLSDLRGPATFLAAIKTGYKVCTQLAFDSELADIDSFCFRCLQIHLRPTCR